MGLWLGLYPSWEGILIPPLALVYVGGAWLWVRFQSYRNQRAAAAQGSAEPAPEPSLVA